MLYVKISAENLAAFEKEMNQTNDAGWYCRLRIVYLSSQAKESVPRLAALFDKCEATVRTYIHAYNTEGLAGLKRDYSPGGPVKLNWTKSQWEDLLAQSPSQFEKLKTAARNWTQPLLVTYWAEYLQVKVTQAAISIALKKHGLRLNRGKLKVTSPDPLYTIKRERIEAFKKKAEAGVLTSHDAPDADVALPPKPAKLHFFDSTDLHWCPDVGYRYVPAGKQQKIDSPGLNNPWRALFGSLTYPTGEGFYTLHERKRHQEVEAHLQRFIDGDPDYFHIVIMDSASAHTTPQLEAFWEKNKTRLKHVFQPTYSPHLNLIERLWRFMRRQMTRNQFYENLEALCKAIVEWLEKVPFAQFCSLMGINENDLEFV